MRWLKWLGILLLAVALLYATWIGCGAPAVIRTKEIEIRRDQLEDVRSRAHQIEEEALKRAKEIERAAQPKEP